MRAKRRRRRRLWMAGLAALLLILGAGGCAFLYFYTPAADRTAASARMPEGKWKALAVRFGPTGDLLTGPATQDELKEQARTTAAQAAAQGMNVLFLYVKDGDSLLYRDRYLPILPALSENAGFFHRPDGLAAFCDAASAQGLAVCAVFEQADLDAGAEALAASAARLFRKYPLLAVYAHTGAPEDALFDDYTPLYGEAPVLPGVAAAGWADPGALFLRTVADRQAGRTFRGAVFALQYANRLGGNLGLMLSAIDDNTPPALLDYTPSAALSVCYPAQGASIRTSTCFIMGTSDPGQELFLDGVPVQRTGEAGTFGVLVNLAEGENTFAFTQGEARAVLTVTRPASTASGDAGTAAERPHDATVEVEPGTAVEVTGWIASLLYDPSSDGNISETVRRGAVATVQSCVETVRSGKTTWAYQLSSGDYILAYNTNVLGQDVPRAQLTGAAARQTAAGEELVFAGSGTPLAYTNRVDNTLVLHFYDADAAADFSVQGSALVKGASVRPLADGSGTEIVLTFDSPLWGHSVEYADGSLMLLLKKAPVRGQDPARPLAGVTVLLDAGHGADDSGAVGAAGPGAPTEKDVNLAVSLAARYRLEQLGAAVEMIRTDDTFLTLAQRNAKITELQPDFFIAVHHNSVELTVDANASSGTECYYFYDSGKALAAALTENISAAAARPSRGALWGYYYVTRSTACPAVLLEVGFMVNPAEYESVTDDSTLWATGDAIARSVLACVPAA